MQSEGGAAGAVHGALQAGALARRSRVAGPAADDPQHVQDRGRADAGRDPRRARTLATHALSIFGDHSDVMAAGRPAGRCWRRRVQEAQDLAAIAHAATLESRVPFLHFFDGFRTSHEVNTIVRLDEAVLRDLIDDASSARIASARSRPTARCSAGPPRTRTSSSRPARRSNPFYAAVPEIVQRTMDRFARADRPAVPPVRLPRAPDAERVIVIMGSGAARPRRPSTS